MNDKLIKNLQYSGTGQTVTYPLPFSLQDSLKLVSDFFSNNTTNKLCLVFPAKEFAVQWLSVPMALSRIEADYNLYKGEIFESYRQYKPGDWLILNDSSIVEWVNGNEDTITIKTTDKSGCETLFNLKHADIIKLQPAPSSRNRISSLERIKKDLPKKDKSPIDKILNLETYGNNIYQKNSVCLISKYVSYDESVYNLYLNEFGIHDYFKYEKIRENGTIDLKCPLLISNTLSNLVQYLTQSGTISEIIIDGYSAINERGTDFSDIDTFKIPTILITDLSEIDLFENIRNYGFEFFDFTNENIISDSISSNSPFYLFTRKLRKYLEFKFHKEICVDSDVESVVQKVHSIKQDESDNNLNILRISLIQIINIISGIVHPPQINEISEINEKLGSIASLFNKNKFWLGEAGTIIDEILRSIYRLLEKYSTSPPEKFIRLTQLLDIKDYNYIICPTEYETQYLSEYLEQNISINTPKVISVSDLDDSLLSDDSVKVLMTAWPKSGNFNRIFSSFLFSEITALYYQFENRYHNSLQRRNGKFIENISATVNKHGVCFSEGQTRSHGYKNLFRTDELIEVISGESLDIVDFELKIESSQYSKYAGKNNSDESVKAKRIDFDQDVFIFSTETHKFLVINELFGSSNKEKKIRNRKVEFLLSGNIIAFINTDRDILVELVEKNTNPEELTSIKYWTELWKKLLREYYSSSGNDFKKLVEDLRKNDCKKHEVTIKTWLQDENRIGPDDDNDLLSIAMLTDSKELFDNITKVRSSISAMTGLRMKASDFINNQIRSRLPKLMDTSVINSEIHIEGLGNVMVLKVKGISNRWEEIDIRYVNRLLHKEIS